VARKPGLDRRRDSGQFRIHASAAFTTEVVYNNVAAAGRGAHPCCFILVFNQASLNSRWVVTPVIRCGERMMKTPHYLS
jgi:hypothetical protein